jgi:hypothetical protein
MSNTYIFFSIMPKVVDGPFAQLPVGTLDNIGDLGWIADKPEAHDVFNGFGLQRAPMNRNAAPVITRSNTWGGLTDESNADFAPWTLAEERDWLVNLMDTDLPLVFKLSKKYWVCRTHRDHSCNLIHTRTQDTNTHAHIGQSRLGTPIPRRLMGWI